MAKTKYSKQLATFPQQLFVKHDGDRDDSWFNATRTVDPLAEDDGLDTTVGVYELAKFVVIKKITQVYETA